MSSTTTATTLTEASGSLHHCTLLERSRGVADHFGIDPDDTTAAFDWLGTYELPAGCSVAFSPGRGTKDGHGLLSRNFDFPTATLSELIGTPPMTNERPLAADPWVIELHPDHGYSSVTVGIMDVMGAMDGINEAGLSVALLADNETPLRRGRPQRAQLRLGTLAAPQPGATRRTRSGRR